MAKEAVKDIQNGASREVSSLKANVGAGIIKEDLEVLKKDAEIMMQDAKVLGRDLGKEGKRQMEYAEGRAKEALDVAKEKGRDNLAQILEYVQKNPGQSLAAAFVGGVIASMIFGRR